MFLPLKRFSFYSGLICILFIACTDRDRTNPLDPKNPETLGRPTGVTVISNLDTVKLSWNFISLNDLVGYRIYRKAQLQQPFQPIELVASEKTTFLDLDVDFDVDYTYKITAVGNDYESPPSDSVKIAPGPTYNWAGNNLASQLIKLTHDARHQIITRTGFFPIVDIEVNSKRREVWVIENLDEEIGNAIRVTSGGEVLRPFVEFTSPVDAALDLNSGALWVADEIASQVAKVDSIGQNLFTIVDFLAPVAVSVDQNSGDCWVVDRLANKIARINRDGTQVVFSPENFDSPTSLAVNSSQGHVWVADKQQVYRVNNDGIIELQLAVAASKIAINENTNDIWIINLTKTNVSKWDETGTKMFEVNEFTSAEALSINSFNNSCLVADSKNNRLVRISEDGKILNRFEQISAPTAVAVQNPFD
ncbi:MAG: hypothetical protein ACE5HS_09595 [bacterium]